MESAEKMNIRESFILQMDNALKHTCKIAKKYYNENNINLLPWPAQSPDLNPNDHLWNCLDRNILENCRNNKQLFQNALLKAWHAIDHISGKYAKKTWHTKLMESNAKKT